MYKTRAEAEGFDYQAEADKTNSIHWNPQHVNFDDFRSIVRQFVELATILNIYKKLLFRGKTPAELDMPFPSESASLAGNGGCIPFDEIDLVHGVIGVMTESGEVGEILLNLLDGIRPDRINAIEESGDLRWYINRILRWAGATDLQCEQMNVDKLHGRHGNSFDVFRDAHRDLRRERERMEALAAPKLERSERRPAGDCEGMDL